MPDLLDEATLQVAAMTEASISRASSTYSQTTLMECTKCGGFDKRLTQGYAICEDCFSLQSDAGC